MSFVFRTRRAAVLMATASAVCATGSLLSVAAPASAATCSDVDLVFARGTGEPQGPSVLQRGTLSALQGGLSGKTVNNYSVVYPAGSDQNAQPGATDMVNRVKSVSANCPNTKFVLGGYSQGGTFGNPLGNNRLAAASPTYSSRIKEFCATGDPVCRNGSNFAAHISYISNGDTTKAGQFAAAQVLANSGGGGGGGTPSEPTPTPTPTPTPSPRPWWHWWG
jgi:cutinase